MEKRNSQGLTEAEFLAQYKPGDYERPSVTVDMLLLGVDRQLAHLRLLLIQRKNHPYIECWALPGGFVEMKESAYEAANRELLEETGLQNVYMEQLYTFSRPQRDPRMRVIDIAYVALLPETDAVAGDDAKDAAWFDVSLTEAELVVENKDRRIRMVYSLKKQEFKNGVIRYFNYVPTAESEDRLAFDHVEILLEGLQRLKNKTEYTDIAFNLVPECFALSDLQRVTELLLGKSIYKKNFRDKIAAKVEETGEKGRSIVGNKKSALYRYKEETSETGKQEKRRTDYESTGSC